MTGAPGQGADRAESSNQRIERMVEIAEHTSGQFIVKRATESKRADGLVRREEIRGAHAAPLVWSSRDEVERRPRVPCSRPGRS